MNTERCISQKEMREETDVMQQIHLYVNGPFKECGPQSLADYTESVKENGMDIVRPHGGNRATEIIRSTATANNISQGIHTRAGEDENIPTYSITVGKAPKSADSLMAMEEYSEQRPGHTKTRKSIILYVFSHLLAAIFNPELFFISITALFFGPVPVFGIGLAAICVNMIESFLLVKYASLGSRAMLLPNTISARTNDDGVYSSANLTDSTAGQCRNVETVDLTKNATWNAMPTSDGTLMHSVISWYVSNIQNPAFVIVKFIFYISMAKELIGTLFASDHRMLKGLAWMGYKYFGSDTLLGFNVGMDHCTYIPSELYNAAGGTWSFGIQNMLVLSCLALPFTACIISRNHDYASIMSIIGSCCSAASLALVLLSKVVKTEAVDALFHALRSYNIYSKEVNPPTRHIVIASLWCLLTGLLYNHRRSFGLFRCLNMLRENKAVINGRRYIHRGESSVAANSGMPILEEKTLQTSDGNVEQVHNNSLNIIYATAVHENLEEIGNTDIPLTARWKHSYGMIRLRMFIGAIRRWLSKNQVVFLCATTQLINLGMGCALADTKEYLPPVAWRHLSWTGTIAQGLLALSATQRAAQCFMAFVAGRTRLNIFSVSTSKCLHVLAYMAILALPFLSVLTNNTILSNSELIICGIFLPIFFGVLNQRPLFSYHCNVLVAVLLSFLLFVFSVSGIWFNITINSGMFNETMVGVTEGPNYE